MQQTMCHTGCLLSLAAMQTSPPPSLPSSHIQRPKVTGHGPDVAMGTIGASRRILCLAAYCANPNYLRKSLIPGVVLPQKKNVKQY